MIFNSLAYLIFLPIVLGIYYILSRRAQNIWLLLASWFFYAWWDWRFLSLVLISTIVDYFCSHAIHGAESDEKKKLYVSVSVMVNLSILGFFKYFDFFAESAASLLSSVGLHFSPYTLGILLPMGISFYTFQTMAYTIDVYRGKVKPTQSLIDFGVYVSYFPQLVAGPIERASHLLPQIENQRKVDQEKVAQGIVLILLGFFKKVAVADVVAPVVERVFSDPGGFEAGMLFLGVYFFAIQIYCDFSGYTDIARGTSKLLGIDLMENFRHPYFSVSITEFWRRWHISLSTWLRDYLYIPLGGNRHGRLNTYRNLMITMLLGGLWHGASWNFVIWGALHGTFLSVHKLILETREKYQFEFLQNIRAAGGVIHWAKQRYISRAVATFFTFQLVCFAWIFFRAPSLSESVSYLSGILDMKTIGEFDLDPWNALRILFVLLILVGVDIMQRRTRNHTFLQTSSWWVQLLVYTCLLGGILTLGALGSNVQFIYFQF